MCNNKCYQCLPKNIDYELVMYVVVIAINNVPKNRGRTFAEIMLFLDETPFYAKRYYCLSLFS